MKKLSKRGHGVLNAKPTHEVDYGRTVLRNRIWRLSREKTAVRDRINRPAPKICWIILQQAGKNLSECEGCPPRARLRCCISIVIHFLITQLKKGGILNARERNRILTYLIALRQENSMK